MSIAATKEHHPIVRVFEDFQKIVGWNLFQLEKISQTSDLEKIVTWYVTMTSLAENVLNYSSSSKYSQD